MPFIRRGEPLRCVMSPLQGRVLCGVPLFVGASPYALLFRPYRATLDYIAPLGHNHDWDLGVRNPEGVK